MINRLLNFLDSATCNFRAVEEIERQLAHAGFIRLDPRDSWHLNPSGKYYMVKNSSAIFAIIPGEAPMAENGVRIISSHSDSPCFKLKPNPEIYGDGGVVSLNVEKYGGAIMYTWFDRPLSLSGRVMVSSGDLLNPREIIFDLQKPVATIPHLAIHFNRAVNEGNPLSVQQDMKPVIGYYPEEEFRCLQSKGGVILNLIAEHLGISPSEIISSEICLYPLEKAHRTGINGEYFQSGRIDDLSMAHASLEAMLATCDVPAPFTRVMAIFDNEETGSGTKQGAHSPVLGNLIERGCEALGGTRTDFLRAMSRSFMISADNAHAWHPNYNAKYDPTNHPVMGGGPVVKINANCKYMTDADGAAVFRQICAKAGVKCQYFVNHADVAGGSTLGNIFTSQIDIRGVDMGNPVWAMHSAAETADVRDQEMAVEVFKAFYLPG